MRGRVALAFARKAKTLAAFDRYERRALSRRTRALRKLRRLRRERVRPIEEVGPPRPKLPHWSSLKKINLQAVTCRKLCGLDRRAQ